MLERKWSFETQRDTPRIAPFFHSRETQQISSNTIGMPMCHAKSPTHHLHTHKTWRPLGTWEESWIIRNPPAAPSKTPEIEIFLSSWKRQKDTAPGYTHCYQVKCISGDTWCEKGSSLEQRTLFFLLVLGTGTR